MSGLYSVIQGMSDEDLRIEIALFTQVNIYNAAKETGSRLISGLTDFAGSLVKSFGREFNIDYDAEKVSDMVRKEADRLSVFSRTDLVEMLRQQLAAKCKITQKELADMSEERLTFLVINEAAKAYNIQNYLTPANKIEKLSIEYNKAFLDVLHNQLVKQDEKQAKLCDEAIQKSLDKVSMETKRELQRKLLPKEFSGKCIGRILRTESGTKYLGYTVELLPVNTFDDVSCHVRTSLFVIKNLRRTAVGVLAHFVWKLRQINDDKFTVKRDILPSYLSVLDEKENDELEKDFRGLLKKRVESDRKLEKCRASIEKNRQKLEQTGIRLDGADQLLSEIREHFNKLEAQKNDFVSGRREESETKRYYSDVNETKRQLDRQNDVIRKLMESKKEYENEAAVLLAEEMEAEEECRQIHKLTEVQLGERAKDLKSRWSSFFYRFTYGPGMFESMIIEFTRADILIIEELLSEVHELKDIKAYEASDGCMKCLLTQNKVANIYMDDNVIIRITRQEIVHNKTETDKEVSPDNDGEISVEE